MNRRRFLFLSAVVLLDAKLLTACSSPKPRPIAYGKDKCAFCQMMISDKQYGSEHVTKTGKVYAYDSIECMVAHALTPALPAKEIHSAWVSDYAKGTLINAKDALYIQSPALRSPMAVNLTAFATRADMEKVISQIDALNVVYEDLPNLVRKSGLLERVKGVESH